MVFLTRRNSQTLNGSSHGQRTENSQRQTGWDENSQRQGIFWLRTLEVLRNGELSAFLSGFFWQRNSQRSKDGELSTSGFFDLRTLEVFSNGELSTLNAELSQRQGIFDWELSKSLGMVTLTFFWGRRNLRPVGMEGEEHIQRGHDTNKARVGVVFSE
jgi:hypothetical protein